MIRVLCNRCRKDVTEDFQSFAYEGAEVHNNKSIAKKIDFHLCSTCHGFMAAFLVRDDHALKALFEKLVEDGLPNKLVGDEEALPEEEEEEEYDLS